MALQGRCAPQERDHPCSCMCVVSASKMRTPPFMKCICVLSTLPGYWRRLCPCACSYNNWCKEPDSSRGGQHRQIRMQQTNTIVNTQPLIWQGLVSQCNLGHLQTPTAMACYRATPKAYGVRHMHGASPKDCNCNAHRRLAFVRQRVLCCSVRSCCGFGQCQAQLVPIFDSL